MLGKFVRISADLIVNIDDIAAVQKRDNHTIDIVFKCRINGRLSEANYYTILCTNARKCALIFNKLTRILLGEEDQ